jgi:hypothetical protein
MSAKRPVALKLLAGLLVCQGLTGIGGGIVLLLHPTGEEMGLSLALLEGSPFRDYLIPGAVLLVWITVQILVVGYQPRPPLQVVYGAVGVVLAGLSLLPSVRRLGHRTPGLQSRPP